MMEIRWHGRGGQGVVTSSQLLANAAILEGKYAVHIPEFGPERRGAPVRSYTRIDDDVIEIRYGVLSPDVVVVIDPTLLNFKELILSGLKEDSIIIFNHSDPSNAKPLDRYRSYVVDAYHIALEVIGRPIYNTAMLGALVGVTNLVKLKSVEEVIKRRFGSKLAEINIRALKKGAEEVRKIG